MTYLKPLEVQFQSLTPLWTGDRNKQCSQTLREAGLLGSFRYWYWLMKRISTDNDNDKEANSLTAFMFGTTGWTKPFRFQLTKSVKDNARPSSIFRFNPNSVYCWTGTFCVIPTRTDDNAWKTFSSSIDDNGLKFSESFPYRLNPEFIEKEWKSLIEFVENYGFWSIGGQNGLGITAFTVTSSDIAAPDKQNQVAKNKQASHNPKIMSSAEVTLPENFFTDQNNGSSSLNYSTLYAYHHQKSIEKNLLFWKQNNRKKVFENLVASKSIINSPQSLLYIPIAYEIRRWLRFKLGEDESAFGKGGGSGSAQAGIVYLSHPFKKDKKDTRYTVRITVARRPGLNTDCKQLLDDIKKQLNWITS